MICEKYVYLPLCILKAYLFKYSETSWSALKILATLLSYEISKDDMNKQQVRWFISV